MSKRALLSSLMVVAVAIVGEPMFGPTPFTMRIVDAQTGEGVPGLRVMTDNGIICFTRPDGALSWGERSVLGRGVSFDVRDDTGRFDQTTANLDVTSGGTATISVHRSGFSK